MINLNHKDLVGGTLIAALGLFVAYNAFHFGIGNASRMGPGYTPAIIGTALIILGVAIAWGSLRFEDPLPAVAWRPVVAVTAGMCAFALAASRLGLVPAVMLLVGIAALGDRESKPLPTLVLALCVAAGMWLVFVLGLRVSLPAFRLDF